MTVYVSFNPDQLEAVTVRARAEGPGVVGDLTREVRPGRSLWGRTYREWRRGGPGAREVDTEGGR